MRNTAIRLCCVLLMPACLTTAGLNGQENPAPIAAELQAAAAWIRSPHHIDRQHDYVVTGALRLLLFWVSRDDVGQGYIRMCSDPGPRPSEAIQLLMGSDPGKAPMGINRWGAAAETRRSGERSSAFFGFMKASKGESVSSVQEELSREGKTGQHMFEGIIDASAGGRALSTSVPIVSDTDFTLHQLPDAQQMVMEKLKFSSREPRILNLNTPAGCPEALGFLFTTRDLIEAILSGQKPPIVKCYVYHARRYTLTLRNCESMPTLKVGLKLRGASDKVERIYQDVKRADFRVVNTVTNRPTDFRIVFGASGEMKGVPVQIQYQPSFWFRLTLNLNPGN